MLKKHLDEWHASKKAGSTQKGERVKRNLNYWVRATPRGEYGAFS